MPLTFDLVATDEATPLLKQALELLEDPTPLNQAVADGAAILTREHLQGLDKHETRNRLNALGKGTVNAPEYYAEKAKSVEGHGSKDAATVVIATGDGAEAFARTDGPVTVTAKASKYLTIPAIPAAYGHRAREFDGLSFIPFGNGTKALVKKMIEMVPGKRKPEIKKVTFDVFYWLEESVVLSQDRSILPSDQQYGEAAEAGADRLLTERYGMTAGGPN